MPKVSGTFTMVAPPPGYSVDFENPQRQLVAEVYIVFVVENLLAVAFLSQLLYTRIGVTKLFRIEDGKTIPDMVFGTAADTKQVWLLLPRFFLWLLKGLYLPDGSGASLAYMCGRYLWTTTACTLDSFSLLHFYTLPVQPVLKRLSVCFTAASIPTASSRWLLGSLCS